MRDRELAGKRSSHRQIDFHAGSTRATSAGPIGYPSSDWAIALRKFAISLPRTKVDRCMMANIAHHRCLAGELCAEALCMKTVT